MQTKEPHSTKIIKRANILLTSDETQGKVATREEIAKRFRTTTTLVHTISKQFVAQGIEAVITRKKRETPLITPIATGEIEAKIIQIACSPAGKSRWTLVMIEKEMGKLGVTISKADRDARKSDDLFKRDFTAGKPLEKCVTDITEIPARDGKLYVSAIFDCYDLSVLGLAMADNMKANLCISTIDNAYNAFPSIRGAIIHSDRGSQYTSSLYRAKLNRCGIVQSMNSAGGRCHDNARCEALWARMKQELLYGRYNTKKMSTEQLKTLLEIFYCLLEHPKNLFCQWRSASAAQEKTVLCVTGSGSLKLS